MASRTIVTVVCDAPDHDAPAPAEHSVQFALAGQTYDIDLCDEHAEQFRSAVQPFVSAGRKQRRTYRRKAA